jgi:hypothetical protein
MTVPKFDSTINLGSLLTIATLLCGASIYYARQEAALIDHSKRLLFLESERQRDSRDFADLRERLATRLTSLETTQATLITLLQEQRHASSQRP